MLKVADLRCEYRQNPIDLFTAKPRFSWKLDGEGTDIRQQAYELEVAAAPDFAEPLWSGKAESGQSHLVPYEGPAAPRGVRHYWRVRVRDAQGRQSGWSEAAWFEAAVLQPAEWEAAFITAEEEDAGASSAGTLLRRTFALQGPTRQARLYITAKGIYQPWCNGQRVGRDLLTPGWTEYHQRLLYQTYDVTGLLRAGENTLGAMVGPGWYKGDLAGWLGRRNIYGTRTALLARLEVDYQDGGREVIVTDQRWQCAPSPVLYSELYHGERYDARLEQPGWCTPDAGAAGWAAAKVESGDLAAVCCQDGLPVREHFRLPAKEIFTTPNGERVVDFGQNLSGWVRLKVRGEAGDRVAYRHAETLDAAGNFYTANLRGARQAVEYTLKGGETEQYEPHFTFQGFRYLCIDAFPGEPAAENFEAVAICSAMRPAGQFECSEPLLNQLVSNVRWGMMDNFVDIPTDCPQRDERLGWTGDAQVFIRAASYLMETAPFFRKWLRDVSAAALPDGGIPHVVPNVLKGLQNDDDLASSDYGATGWGDIATVAPWTLYKSYGDIDLLREQYHMMKNWVEYIRANAQDGVLWNTGFHYGDWVALDAKEGSYFGATPNDLTATAFYAYSTRLLAKAAGVLGHRQDAEQYARLYEDIRTAFANEFYTPSGRLAARTQTAHILALVFGLAPAAHQKRTLDTLVELIAENGNHLTTGFLGTPFICRALSENGRLDLAYELLLKTDYPSWLYQVKQGATTIWEHWDGLKPDGTMWSDQMNSFNHYAYGAVADWIFSVVGGLDSSEESPGYRAFTLSPRPGGGLRYARMAYDSVYGTIALRWEARDGQLLIEASVPANTTATLVLPDAKGGTYGGHAFEATEGGAVAQLGSGTYAFRYPWGPATPQ